MKEKRVRFVLFFLLTTILLTFGSTNLHVLGNPTSTQLLANGGFEGTPWNDGWQLWSGDWAEETTTYVHEGSSSCRLNFSTCDIMGCEVDIVYEVPVSTPNHYYCAAWIFNSGVDDGRINLHWYDGTTEVGGDQSVDIETLGTGWQELTVDKYLDVGTTITKVAIHIRMIWETPTFWCYVDDVRFGDEPLDEIKDIAIMIPIFIGILVISLYKKPIKH